LALSLKNQDHQYSSNGCYTEITNLQNHDFILHLPHHLFVVLAILQQDLNVMLSSTKNIASPEIMLQDFIEFIFLWIDFLAKRNTLGIQQILLPIAYSKPGGILQQTPPGAPIDDCSRGSASVLL
jgi:hypothetical protein